MRDTTVYYGKNGSKLGVLEFIEIWSLIFPEFVL